MGSLHEPWPLHLSNPVWKGPESQEITPDLPEREPRLEQHKGQPRHFLTSLLVRVGSARMITSAQHTAVGSLKGTEGAREEGGEESLLWEARAQLQGQSISKGNCWRRKNPNWGWTRIEQGEF